MPDIRKYQRLSDLIYLALEDAISEPQMAEMNGLIETDPLARQYYLDYLDNFCAVTQAACILQVNDETHYNPEPFYEVIGRDLEESDIRCAMAEAETERESNSTGIAIPPRRRLTDSQWRRLALNVAAVVLLCLTVLWLDRQLMENQSGPAVSVAVMTDALNARWRADGIDYRIGEKIYPGDLKLETGWVQFGFIDGAVVVVEAPAEITLAAADRLVLNRGRVFARVSPQASGFTVVTPSSTVIDLGTEFGVDVDTNGTSQVHMIKGKATLIAGVKGSLLHNQLIVAGEARQINPVTGDITTIASDASLFARTIHGKTGLVWRGQALSLADMVGGGNGLGTGTLGAGIDPMTGSATTRFHVIYTSGDMPDYRSVNANPFIDGVFVPDGGRGPVRISSQGHLFPDCPDTSGQFWVGIEYGGRHYHLMEDGTHYQIKDHALRLAGERYDSKEKPAIFMHANQGITFDLAAIRAAMPELAIRRFTARCGLSETIFDGDIYASGANPNYSRDKAEAGPKGDFWVLIDGRVRFAKSGQRPTDAPGEIDIPIARQDRYLTLIATDHDETGHRYLWSLFALPELKAD